MPGIEESLKIPKDVVEDAFGNTPVHFADQIKGMTDEEINSVVAAAESERKDMPNVEVNPDAELIAAEGTMYGGKFIGVTGRPEAIKLADAINGYLGGETEIDRIAATIERPNLLDIGTPNEKDIEVDNSAAIMNTANNVKNTFALSDEEVFRMVNTLTQMKKDPKYPVYANLPESVQMTIAQLAAENGVSPMKLNDIARGMMEEFISQAGVDMALVDLESALDEALQIPTIVDMYSEHTVEVMDKIIPETIEKIRDEFPEKAAKLEAIRTGFHEGYDFSRAKKVYESNARLRKSIRRWEQEYDRVVTRFNYMNEKTKFKMNDASQVFDTLEQVLIKEPDEYSTVHMLDDTEFPSQIQKALDLYPDEEDIKKFCILIMKSCENMDANDPVDAAYMYYMIRNIIMLAHTNDAKTNFAVELISNICDTITFIRDKESEFNESNVVKSKQSKKRNA